MMRLRASLTLSPCKNPALLFMVPSMLIEIVGANFISLKNWMSERSPAEHIMTSPVPLSICAKGCASMGTSLL